MDKRLELHNILCGVTNSSKNVYYNPPPNLNIIYPCIKYSKDDVNDKYANNQTYNRVSKYMITVISTEPDDCIIDKLLNLNLSSYNRHYIHDGLHHDVITLYY